MKDCRCLRWLLNAIKITLMANVEVVNCQWINTIEPGLYCANTSQIAKQNYPDSFINLGIKIIAIMLTY